MTWKAADLHLRHCKKCGVLTPKDGFYPRNDGYFNLICKLCIKIREKAHLEKMKKNLLWRWQKSENTKAYMKRKKEAKDWLYLWALFPDFCVEMGGNVIVAALFFIIFVEYYLECKRFQCLKDICPLGLRVLLLPQTRWAFLFNVQFKNNN